MNKNPLFSVLIANYNNINYLLEAVESIRRQTYTNWQIIIVDDYSTDNLDELYSELISDDRIDIYFNERNRGAGYTFRRCMDFAEGEICGLVGGDDVLEETAIEKMVQKHTQLPNYSIVYSLLYICDNNLKPINNLIGGGALPKDECQLTTNGVSKITSLATFKSSFYKLTEGIDPQFKRALDQDLYYKLEEVGDVYCINEPLYYYRIHNHNISRNQNSTKAIYWNYLADKEAYVRRKKKKLHSINITYGELQRRYLKVCLRKINDKLTIRQYKNLLYYYCQLIRLSIWDKDLLIMKHHIVLLKKAVISIIKRVYPDFPTRI